MRFSAFALIAAMTIVLGTGCSGKNNNNQNSNSSDATATSAASAADQSMSSPAPEISATAEASGAMGGSTDKADDVPLYPGATVQAAGSSMMAGGTTQATGKILTTNDSFDDVYRWYQKNLPAGSEKAHITSPVETATFVLSATDDNNQTSVTISTSSGKTLISIGKVTR